MPQFDHKLPSFAILLASYNGGPFITEQIHSILAQTDSEVQIFIRDDGSTDGTVMIVSELQTAVLGRITVVSDSLGPTGSAAANFFALLNSVDLTSFDYIAFADQDDIWLPGKLKRAFECISNQGGGGYSSNLTAWECDSGTYWEMRKHGKRKKHDYLFQGASAGCTYVLDAKTALLVRQRLAPLERRYCRGISHDWVIYAICRSADVPWFRDTEAYIHYRQHANNVYGALPGLAGIAARFEMISNGWYREHILWLENVIENNPAERRLFARFRRDGLLDRLYLAVHAGNFRRDRNDVWKLRLAFLLGLLGK